MTTKVRYDRLEKLATFLDALPRERFDFSVQFEKRDCGTVGCAIGWTPKVFPWHVRWGEWVDHVDAPVASFKLRGDHCPRDFEDVAVALFGVDRSLAYGLFAPAEASRAPWQTTAGPERDWRKATPKQVAGHIRRFIKWHKKQEATE